LHSSVTKTALDAGDLLSSCQRAIHNSYPSPFTRLQLMSYVSDIDVRCGVRNVSRRRTAASVDDVRRTSVAGSGVDVNSIVADGRKSRQRNGSAVDVDSCGGAGRPSTTVTSSGQRWTLALPQQRSPLLQPSTSSSRNHCKYTQNYSRAGRSCHRRYVLNGSQRYSNSVDTEYTDNNYEQQQVRCGAAGVRT